MQATTQEIAQLEAMYAGRKVFYGELHDHAKTGGTSDGRCTLDLWKREMRWLGMDFAAIVDHSQVRHMYLPEWEDGVFIGGTELGCTLVDSKARVPKLHYMMLFEGPKPLEQLFYDFPEFEFTGAPDGTVKNCNFKLERFRELVQRVRELGGFFVHPHPLQVMASDDPLDFWFGDETGMEVFVNGINSDFTKDNYPLWVKLLKAGKRVWVTAGTDFHRAPYTDDLTTLYAEEKSNKAYLSHIREGDMVCGFAGIRMVIGDTKMGGKCDFTGKKLIFSVGDFHHCILRPGHDYRVDVMCEDGEICRFPVKIDEMNYFTIDIDPSKKFYRLEVTDDTQKLRIALGNPIWNTNA